MARKNRLCLATHLCLVPKNLNSLRASSPFGWVAKSQGVSSTRKKTPDLLLARTFPRNRASFAINGARSQTKICRAMLSWLTQTKRTTFTGEGNRLLTWKYLKASLELQNYWIFFYQRRYTNPPWVPFSDGHFWQLELLAIIFKTISMSKDPSMWTFLGPPPRTCNEALRTSASGEASLETQGLIRPFRPSHAPTICPWISEDGFSQVLS